MKSACLRGIAASAVAMTVATGCNNTPQAMGNVNSIIVITTDSLWAAVGDSLQSALEPRILAVRNERAFEVTHVSPQDPNWTELREFKNVLVIGTAQDGWVAPVLEEANAANSTAPAIVRTSDVWARNQFATALVVPHEQSAEAVFAHADRVAMMNDSAFRAYALGRMYTSKPDTLLRDTLMASEGFGILLPQVYYSVRRGEGVQLFQSSTQIRGDLVRSVLITSRPGLVDAQTEVAVAWRDSIADTAYRPSQATQRDPLQTTSLSGDKHGIDVQGVWQGEDPTWPMGGPFITRLVHCPNQNRTFLIDAWVYSPGGQRGSKYEYMIQLQTILDTFECASARAAQPGVRRGARYAVSWQRLEWLTST